MTRNIIELNGKRYDAVTGALLTPHVTSTPAVAHSQATRAKAVDGIIKVPSKAQTTPKATQKPTVHHSKTTHTSQAKYSAPAAKPAKAHAVAPHATAHQPQHSKTLMRHAVKQPAHPTKRHIKVTVHTDKLAKKATVEIAPKSSWQAINPTRLHHAKHIERSSLISHFSALGHHTPQAVSTRQPIHPTANPVHTHTPATRPTPLHITRSTPLPNRQPSTDIFERALAQANSHLQPAPHIKRAGRKARRVRQFLGFGTSTLIALFALGFVMYPNVDAIQVHIASSRAGINATMPAWQPSGFSAQQFSYSPGKVTIGFAAEGSRKFSLTQTASKWDSSALLTEYVAPHNHTYDTIQADGRLIYAYGNNNASWVNNGIWYQLVSDGTLSTSQLVRLATST